MLEKVLVGTMTLQETRSDFAVIMDEIMHWCKLLEKDYGDPNKFSIGVQINISREHVSKLLRDTNSWIGKINDMYDESPTKLINIDTLEKETINLVERLDEKAAEDLLDAEICIINGIPTAAATMLYRVGESVIRKYYALEMGHSPSEGTTMGGMANEIRIKQSKEIEDKKRTKPDSILNFILSQVEDRNITNHPEKRFKPSEAEELFIFIKKLILDIDKKLNDK
ncbi:MAG: hypothetical protein HKP26_06925 [Nitrosopumilus sp.]|nr:hypothetical protein [Nitrosopumilus sp.]